MKIFTLIPHQTKVEAMANQCSQLSLLLTALLFMTATIISVVSGQSGGEWLISESDLITLAVFSLSGVNLTLNGDTVSNDSTVLVTAIGEGSGGLFCNTDRSDCCRASTGVAAQGHWYFPGPSGDRVLIENMRTGDFFYRDRGTGVVRLNRRNNPTERGRFRCEIPDINGDVVNLYVNIGEWLVLPLTTRIFFILYKLII